MTRIFWKNVNFYISVAFISHGKLCFELVHLLQGLDGVIGFCVPLPGCSSILAYGLTAYVRPRLLPPLLHCTFTAGLSPGLPLFVFSLFLLFILLTLLAFSFSLPLHP